MHKYLMGRCREDEARLFSVISSGNTTGKGHKLKYRNFHLNKEVAWVFLTRGDRALGGVAQRLWSLHALGIL